MVHLHTGAFRVSDGGSHRSVGDGSHSTPLGHSSNFLLGDGGSHAPASDGPRRRLDTASTISMTPMRELGERDSLYIPPVTEITDAKPVVAKADRSTADTEKPRKPESSAEASLPKTVISDTVLDTRKSVADLMESGILKKTDMLGKESEVSDRTQKLTDGAKPEITVRYADPNNQTKPDFVIGTDGTMHVMNNPETSGDKQIIIELERPVGGDAALSSKQQESVDQLVAYLNTRMPQVDEAFKSKGVDIEDPQGLVSKELKGALDKDNYAEMAPQTREQVERLNRLPGRGSMPASDAGEYFPRRDVPRQQGETDTLAAGKEAVAAVFNPDKQQPYETVRERRGDRGHRVGRYGFSYNMWAMWLDMLGEDVDPNDPESVKKAMKKLAAKGKVPKDFAAKFDDPNFAKGFSKFLTTMKTGEGQISSTDVGQFLPKELQETMATDLMKSFSESSGQDMGKVVLGFHLGKNPSELSAEDMNNPVNQAIAKAGREFFQLESARQQSRPGDQIDYSRGPTSELQFKLLDAAKNSVGRSLWAEGDFRNSVKGGRLGCAAAVSEVLQDVGFGYANSAGVGNLSDTLINRGWQRV